MMPGKILFVLSILLILSICGCNSLPDGTPPAGNIVEPFKNNQKILSRQEAVNYMITSLTMRCQPVANASRPPAVIKAFERGHPEMNALPEAVFSGVQKMSMIRPAPSGSKADYRLESEIAGNEIVRWKMKFVSADGKKEFWSETVEIQTGKQ